MTPYAQTENNLITVGNMADGNHALLRNVLKHMILATHGLDQLCQQSPEGTDISLYVNSVSWLRHRINHLAPPAPKKHGPTHGCDVIDFAQERMKRA